MKYYIQTLNDNGSGMKYNTKEELLNEIALMIDDCISNGGTYISFDVDCDASCFCTESYTAFLYEDDGIITEDLSTYDNKEDAIEFAKHRNWDEVVNDITGEVVWRK